ncbi:hypothetical protein BVX99_01760 [bacterium F16]|nr:hypothetical protein BVX99_01760 [bacterium F16]
MISRKLSDIEIDDIHELVSSGSRESLTLEYKQCLWTKTMELLKDISALANASGGDIVVGITDNDGLPGEVVGISGAGLDQKIAGYESQIQNCIQPLLKVKIKAIKDTEETAVLVFRVPRSYQAPHLVTYDKNQRFYSRNNSGVQPMDIYDIRASVLQSELLHNRVMSFHNERIETLSTPPIQTDYPAKFILHVIPLSSFAIRGARISAPEMERALSPIKSPNMDQGVETGRFNSDGYLRYLSSKKEEGCSPSYCQTFRSGVIEAVCSAYFGLASPNRVGANLGTFPPKRCLEIVYESGVVGFISQCMEFYLKVEIPPPYIVQMSMTGVEGYMLGCDLGKHPPAERIDRASVCLPDVIIEDFDSDVAVTMKPVFDAVWNAFGHVGSTSYDEDGNFRPHR